MAALYHLAIYLKRAVAFKTLNTNFVSTENKESKNCDQWNTLSIEFKGLRLYVNVSESFFCLFCSKKRPAQFQCQRATRFTRDP